MDAGRALRGPCTRSLVAVFLDTNVVVYAYDRNEPVKRELARAVLANDDELWVSTQVMTEFYWVVTRRLTHPLPEAQAAEVVAGLVQLSVVAATAALVTSAIELSRRRQLQLWDALIVRAAQAAGCERLLSEDFQNGARFDNVHVENPFAG